MTQERTFKIPLKNDQTVELKFNSIAATSDQLWQMFATAEALDVLQQLIDASNPEQTKSARKTALKKNK
jgi:hypothetical protein